MGRNKTIELDDVLDNIIYINGVSFERFFYRGVQATWYFGSREGKIYSDANDLIMQPSIDRHGYEYLLMRIPGIDRPMTMRVHAVIATIYYGWYDDLVVDHIDGDPRNNNVTNLRWVTMSQNAWFAYNTQKTHKRRYGDANSNSRYSDAQVREACKLLQSGVKPTDVSRRTGISMNLVHALMHKKARVNISSEYAFPPILFAGPRRPLSQDVKERILHLRNDEHLQLTEIEKLIPEATYNQIVHAIYDSRYID